MPDNRLNESEIQNIKALARSKLVEYHKLNDVIGAQIFSILEKDARVLYYPLEDHQVWGFSEIIKGKSFVCINTSLPYDKQVFAAAHELYHLWFGHSGEIMISKNTLEPDSEEKTERMANRFAAEFLVNDELLFQEMRLFKIDKGNFHVKEIVKLANHFVVPYHTMVRRFFETGICTQKQYEELMSCTEEQAEIWRSRLGISVPIRKEKIGLNNLVDKAMELYERNLITYEKLEHLLGLAELTPQKMGIGQKTNYTPPTDDELDAIVRE